MKDVFLVFSTIFLIMHQEEEVWVENVSLAFWRRLMGGAYMNTLLVTTNSRVRLLCIPEIDLWKAKCCWPTSWHKPYHYSDQMIEIFTPIQTTTIQKSYPLALHILYLAYIHPLVSRISCFAVDFWRQTWNLLLYTRFVKKKRS